MKVCLYDHHQFIIPTDGIGGVIGTFQILYDGLKKNGVDLTLIVNENSTLQSEKNFKVIKLPFSEIQNLRFGLVPVVKYFQGDIFYSNSSGRNVNFDFSGFKGKWVSTCHGCEENVGGADCQIFVSNNQLIQHFRDNLFDNFGNDYRVIYNVVDTNDYFFEPGSHDKIVWMGRIDGAKSERLYDIASNLKHDIIVAGWYTDEFKWLFEKLISLPNIKWVGKIEGVKEKRKFYSNAKLSIHCSTFEDPCPTTVLEAQACGIPVATYSNGSMNEICFDKSLIFDKLENLKNYIENQSDSIFPKLEERIQFIESKFNANEYSKKYYKIFKSLKNE